MTHYVGTLCKTHCSDHHMIWEFVFNDGNILLNHSCTVDCRQIKHHCTWGLHECTPQVHENFSRLGRHQLKTRLHTGHYGTCHLFLCTGHYGPVSWSSLYAGFWYLYNPSVYAYTTKTYLHAFVHVRSADRVVDYQVTDRRLISLKHHSIDVSENEPTGNKCEL